MSRLLDYNSHDGQTPQPPIDNGVWGGPDPGEPVYLLPFAPQVGDEVEYAGLTCAVEIIYNDLLVLSPCGRLWYSGVLEGEKT
jgi:hypothetical protein